MEVSRRVWDYPLTMQIEEPTTVEMQSGENAVAGVDPIPEDCIPSGGKPRSRSVPRTYKFASNLKI
ncbi:hypothetical protein RJ641_029659 [Dillenia turbinata]|uniref:Uncharacterized protein n=1 Tax=Dillenia turbinata TaxID=194707 RepID=A0AAN8ZMX7_9MAGN